MTRGQAAMGLFLYGAVLMMSLAVGSSKGHVTVVLVGATGDLSRKYLWQALFQLYTEHSSEESFCFYGTTRLDKAESTPVIAKALKGLTCPDNVPSVRCSLLKDQFTKLTRYQQLDTLEDYTTLSKSIRDEMAQEGLEESGRLFYLSVPAFAYADIAEKINGTARPPAGSWLRVVFEKPFGHDLASAQQLAEQLQRVLQEDEMYRIDHYLGKQAIGHILKFRHDNRQHLDTIWNQHHIERVEIVMKETVDSKGRTSFYEQYGVICDVIQNHLTEILTFVAMETPVNLSSSEEIHRNKMKVYGSLGQLGRESAVIAQYQAYNSEVQEELGRPAHSVSTTPTFAGVAVYVESSRWDGVPFILTAGKALDERVGYTRVLFKKQAFCLQSESVRRTESSQCQPRQIVFYVGHGDLNFPAVLVSRNLFEPAMDPAAWKRATELPDVRLFGLRLSDFHVFRPVVQKDAYAVLIPNILRAKRDSFVNTEGLLASWKFWTPLLGEIFGEQPRLYPGGVQSGESLDFVVAGREVSFITPEPALVLSDEAHPAGQGANSYRALPAGFRGGELVSARAEVLVSQLASRLEGAAWAAVGEDSTGRFHLALSGGSSPVALFRRLARHHPDFPWKRTHVWLVDERCVPLDDPESNFRSLHDHLLQRVRVPYVNLHPMPVQLNQRLCVEEDGGPGLYAKDIEVMVNGTSFDFVLLGAGVDGHTASLFPNSQALASENQLVLFSESPVKPHQRMTLSLSVINRARQVAVLITGKGKRSIVSEINRVGTEPQKWPITGIQPSQGKVTWFIDYDALLG